MDDLEYKTHVEICGGKFAGRKGVVLRRPDRIEVLGERLSNVLVDVEGEPVPKLIVANLLRPMSVVDRLADTLTEKVPPVTVKIGVGDRVKMTIGGNAGVVSEEIRPGVFRVEIDGGGISTLGAAMLIRVEQ